MSRIWKAIVIVSLLSSAASLLYAYAAAHPNPYSREHYELEQVKVELRQLKQELEELRGRAVAGR